jgi:hypothetical protein
LIFFHPTKKKMDEQRDELVALMYFYSKLASDTRDCLTSNEKRLERLRSNDDEREALRIHDLLEDGILTLDNAPFDSPNLDEIQKLQRERKRLNQSLAGHEGELDRFRQKLEQLDRPDTEPDNDDALRALEDVFGNEDTTRPVTTVSFRQKTISALKDYVEFMEQALKAQSTNDAQDEYAEEYSDLAPGARFVLRVIKGNTEPNAHIPRFDSGIEMVKQTFFDKVENRSWNDIMSGKATVF